MDLFIDTCSWLKLDALSKNNLFLIENLYDFGDINITHDILFELDHFNCNVWIKERSKIIPVKNKQVFDEAITLDFDKADASLLSNGSKELATLIISEDNLVLRFARMYQFAAIQLIDLIRILVQQNILSKNELYKINRYLREMRNITLKKEKEIKQWLAEYRSLQKLA